MSRSRKLLRASGFWLLAAVVALGLSFLTGGFGPCGSVSGFFCGLAMVLCLGIAGLLLIVALAQWIVGRIPT
jgi:hypothetical protein